MSMEEEKQEQSAEPLSPSEVPFRYEIGDRGTLFLLQANHFSVSHQFLIFLIFVLRGSSVQYGGTIFYN